MTTSPKRKEAPAEPFKRALGVCVRAIAGDGEVQVAFTPGRPEIEGHHIQLPEPSRVPSQREIAVIRGWADSLALTAACHDQKIHKRLAPPAGSARWLRAGAVAIVPPVRIDADVGQPLRAHGARALRQQQTTDVP